MGFGDDPRLIEAKQKSVADVLERLKIYDLRKTTRTDELTGPCPQCRDAGHNSKKGKPDRFNINLTTGAFFCRRCDIRGGDVIALVREVERCSFPEALTFLCGERPQEETEEQKRDRLARQKELEEKLEAEEEEREREAEKYRQNAIKAARSIWQRSRPGELGVVRAYLDARGLGEQLLPYMPNDLNFIVDHPYVKKIDGELKTPHRGPCMIAAIRAPNGELMAVHQTWVDSNPPHGKASIPLDEGKLPAKMVRGSKKGGAIRLYSPSEFDTLVMGEGIETTLTAAAAWNLELDPMRTAYWAGVDLGNMAGKMKDPRKKTGIPDMSDVSAFVPPPWVKRLIFIMDGDSDPKTTRAKLECGLRRAMANVPGLKGQIVHAGEGVDLNDLLVKEKPNGNAKD